MTYDANVTVQNEFLDELDEAVFATGVFLEGLVKKKLGDERFDTGGTARSVTTNKNGEYKAIVGSNLMSAVIAETGRKPRKGFPNFDALVGRSKRKGIISGNATASYDSLSNKDKSAIYLVARSIDARGIKKKEIWTRTLEENKKKLEDFYARKIS